MFDSNFDPYEILINLKHRVDWLEKNQYELARGMNHTQETISTLMSSIKSLQTLAIDLDRQVRILKERIDG
jgi:hypothetical protein